MYASFTYVKLDMLMPEGYQRALNPEFTGMVDDRFAAPEPHDLSRACMEGLGVECKFRAAFMLGERQEDEPLYPTTFNGHRPRPSLSA